MAGFCSTTRRLVWSAACGGIEGLSDITEVEQRGRIRLRETGSGNRGRRCCNPVFLPSGHIDRALGEGLVRVELHALCRSMTVASFTAHFLLASRDTGKQPLEDPVHLLAVKTEEPTVEVPAQ
jgi:hypothetical protein